VRKGRPLARGIRGGRFHGSSSPVWGRGRRERAECERRGLGEGDSWPRPHTFPLPKRRSACRVCAHLGRVRMWASCGWATLQLALASQWIFFCSSEVPCFNTTTTHVLGNRKSRFRKIWLHDFPSLHLPLVQVCTTARTSDRISTKQGTEGGRIPGSPAGLRACTAMHDRKSISPCPRARSSRTRTD
jgi:hypothetical protein